MARVGIVTDSTCDLELAEYDRLGVSMVPLKVLFGEESFRDWVDLDPADFYVKLAASPTLPKTSQPSPADFTAAYQKLADEGCDGIVSIHLSAALSGTCASALMAAEDAPVPVHVVDTKKATQAVALVVKAACEARDEGLDAEQVAKRALDVTEKTRLFFVVDTLDNLVKGGRAGKAQGLAAALLNIKPVLEVNSDGIVAPFKKVKGRKKALAEVAAHVAEEARALGPMRLALLHACTDDCAADLRQEIEAAGAGLEVEWTGVVGAVIGTYAGPGAVGCAYYPIR